MRRLSTNFTLRESCPPFSRGVLTLHAVSTPTPTFAPPRYSGGADYFPKEP